MSHLFGAISANDVGDSLREGFFMFWETLWALVLGFGLSGAVQAFVSKDSRETYFRSSANGEVSSVSVAFRRCPLHVRAGYSDGQRVLGDVEDGHILLVALGKQGIWEP